MLSNHICALDIGNSKISACVADLRNKRIAGVFFESVPSKGMHNGTIVNAIELVHAVSKVLKSLKDKSGINIKYVYANVSGQDILTKHSRAIIPLTERGNKVITPSDLEKIREQALTLGASLEEEVLHDIPCSYTIDSKSAILNPLGLYSHKLEMDLLLVNTRLSCLQSFTHAIHQAGYELKELYFSGLATSEAALSDELKKGFNVLLDIGSDMTEMLIFEDTRLKSVEILPVGGNTLTAALKEAFDIPFDFAEDIKRSYAIIEDPSEIKEDKEILIKKDQIYKPIKQRMVSETITAKARSMSQDIKAALEKYVPLIEVNGIYVSGRAILQDGMLELLEKSFGVRTQIARLMNPRLQQLAAGAEELSGRKYLTYVSSLGIVCLAMQEYRPMLATVSEPIRNPIKKIINKVKEVYQEYF